MRWEYRTVIEANCYDLNKKLNQLGKSGWEAYGSAMIQYRSGYVVHIVHLKRPKR